MRAFRYSVIFLVFVCQGVSFALSPSNPCDLMHDLMKVRAIDEYLNDEFPVTYNHFLQGGYINMPSARVGQPGEIGMGYSSVPPYHNINARLQLLDFLELTGSYRIFRGVADGNLSSDGFGDFSDKGANVKVVLLHPEESDYKLPGIAIGIDDFLGTQAFYARYVVATQVFPNWNLEVSLGLGEKRIKGLFGGAAWMPWRKCAGSYLAPLVFTAEYDATPYEDARREPHPDGRTRRIDWNLGLKYRLCDAIDTSISWVRGKELAFSVSAFYNFGTTKGLIPKYEQCSPYRCPRNTEPIGCLRTEGVVAQDFYWALKQQGFLLLGAWIECDPCGGLSLRLNVLNQCYFRSSDVHERLSLSLAHLTPCNVDQVIVMLEAEGFAIQEYRFPSCFLERFSECQMGLYELSLLTPPREVSYCNSDCSKQIYCGERSLFCFDLLPKVHTFFGSSRGKVKYALGLRAGAHGFLPCSVYYEVLFGKQFIEKINDIQDFDRLNPSQIINVRTDFIRYYQQDGVTLDRAFLQKNCALGCGWYGKLAGGYFNEGYGGVGSEILYAPIEFPWAIGIEGALLRKRRVGSLLAFTPTIRKLVGTTPTFLSFKGSQYFLDLYYHWKEMRLDFKTSVGQFLAKDQGAKFEVGRLFESGLRISFWYTYTNGNDVINGERYHDKGIEVSMPLDIFYPRCSRRRWGNRMSAWLRDVGYRSQTGRGLYDMIRDQRDF